MKVLLCKPYWNYPYDRGEHTYNRVWPPLCLANYAAILEREGHEVKILDAHALRIKPQDIGRHVEGFDAVFVTSSTLDRWQCPNIDISTFLETVASVKASGQDVYLLGYHGTVAPDGILKQTRANAVIRGEAEMTIVDLCAGRPLNDIKGITYFDGERIISNPDRENIDLKTLPLPALHLLDMRRYEYEVLGGDFGLFEIGRGCKWSCKFCNKLMYEPVFRVKSIEQIQQELSVAIERYGIKTGYFIDLEFLSKKDLVEEVCDFLIEQGYDFRWCCQTRADSLDGRIVEKMKRAGCQLIHMGVESGLQKFLDLSGKNTTEEKLRRGVALCQEAGIKTLAFFMLGLRGETARDREDILTFATKLNTDFVSFHKVYPYISSNIYLPDIHVNKKIDRFILKAYLVYYLRMLCLGRFDLAAMIKGAKIFWGRLATVI